MDGVTTITLSAPGMEPVTADLDTFKKAAAILTGRTGRRAIRDALDGTGRINDPHQLALDDHPEFKRAAEQSSNGFNTKSVAADQLKAFIERIERLEEEKAGIAGDIKDVYAEAKGNGFDTKVLRKIISLRKRDYAERQKEEAILELYMQALGMV
jgi:uncharacterized protein (UPF0335 family)